MSRTTNLLNVNILRTAKKGRYNVMKLTELTPRLAAEKLSNKGAAKYNEVVGPGLPNVSLKRRSDALKRIQKRSCWPCCGVLLLNPSTLMPGRIKVIN